MNGNDIMELAFLLRIYDIPMLPKDHVAHNIKGKMLDGNIDRNWFVNTQLQVLGKCPGIIIHTTFIVFESYASPSVFALPQLWGSIFWERMYLLLRIPYPSTSAVPSDV